MAWVWLLLASVLEVAFAIGLKASAGFSKPWWTAFTVVATIGSITFLTLALKTLPISVGYPIWTGLGAVGTVLIGVLVLGESWTALRVASVGLIVLGVIGLRVGAEASGEGSATAGGEPGAGVRAD